MKLIEELQDAGYSLRLSDGKIVYKWTRPDPPDPERFTGLINELRSQKERVKEYLSTRPADCEDCPAAGFWDGYRPFNFYAGRYCFYAAYFLGKTKKPRRCEEARRECPKKTQAHWSDSV